MIIPIARQRLSRIEVPVPPGDIFERIFGYWGERQYVLLHGPVEGGELTLEDGVCREKGYWQAWIYWRQSPVILDSVAGRRNDVWFVLDRLNRKIYCGSQDNAYAVIRRQSFNEVDPPTLALAIDGCHPPEKVEQFKRWTVDYLSRHWSTRHP